MQQRSETTTWAVNRAQEIVLKEGFDLIKSARTLDQTAIRTNGMLLAKAIAASLVEASAAVAK
ncbi:hypothetical protein [Pararhizobium sp.]|uniref:hypothetical protein n=1 Tax=Pararhizobium sp. TaxID=1977563 RepID=UPI002727C52D|nr:hypothetical protein [Pararhizobium sp.]MDO9415158.1 hypothetical protein [Pararhizobium sp.]